MQRSAAVLFFAVNSFFGIETSAWRVDQELRATLFAPHGCKPPTIFRKPPGANENLVGHSERGFRVLIAPGDSR
jgi:hypothetical protein